MSMFDAIVVLALAAAGREPEPGLSLQARIEHEMDDALSMTGALQTSPQAVHWAAYVC